MPGRSKATITLPRGLHEITVALDTDKGFGWGIFFCFEVPKEARKGRNPVFPVAQA